MRKLELVMKQAGVTPEICPAVAAALAKAEATGAPAGAMQLPDGRMVTGKTSGLLGAAAALLLNALKALGGIEDQFELISRQVLEPVCHLKTTYLDHRNPRLHTDEVLLTLCHLRPDQSSGGSGQAAAAGTAGQRSSLLRHHQRGGSENLQAAGGAGQLRAEIRNQAALSPVTRDIPPSGVRRRRQRPSAGTL